jgi:hypothetical protein
MATGQYLMRKILAALLLFYLNVTAAEAAQVTYGFTLDLNGIADQTQYSQSVIQSTWTDPNLTYVSTGDTGTNHFFWVVHNGTSSDTCLSSRCLEMRFPQGGLGANPGVAGWGTASFRIKFAQATIINAEWDLLFETSFDSHSIIKVPLHIQTWDATNSWWTLGQENVQCSGTYTATTCNGSPVWVSYEERSNGTNACSSYFGPMNKPVQKHFWYHLRRQVNYTSAPATTVTKLWIQGPGDSSPQLVWTCIWNSNYNPAVRSWGIIEDEFHWGGAGNNDKPQQDTHMLMDNVHIYTGP